MEYYSAVNKNEIVSFAAPWLNLEISEVRQGNTNILWYHLYVESKKRYKWIYLQNRNKLTDIKKKLRVTGEDRGRD